MMTWNEIVLRSLPRSPRRLSYIYKRVAQIIAPLGVHSVPEKNCGPNWKAKVRQTLQFLTQKNKIKKVKQGVWANLSELLPHCSTCRRPPEKGHLTCSFHLDLAAFYDRERTVTRNARGLCRSCDQPKLPNNSRCAACRDNNKQKCLAWMAAHPENTARQWAKTQELWLNRGLCRCSAHNPLPPGYRRCDDCRLKARQRKKTA